MSIRHGKHKLKIRKFRKNNGGKPYECANFGDENKKIFESGRSGYLTHEIVSKVTETNNNVLPAGMEQLYKIKPSRLFILLDFSDKFVSRDIMKLVN